MEVILSRLLSPQLLIWTLVAAIGVTVAAATIWLMIYEIRLHPKALQIPQIRSMKRHNLLSEIIRLSAQVVALLIVLAYVLDLVNGSAIGWALVFMNTSLVFNSVNEFWLTVRLLILNRGHEVS